MSRSWEETRTKLKAWLKLRVGMDFRDVSWGPDLKRDGQVCDVTIEIQGSELAFSRLQQISEILRTKLINITSNHQSDGCPTCGYGCESWVELNVREAVLPLDIYDPVQ